MTDIISSAIAHTSPKYPQEHQVLVFETSRQHFVNKLCVCYTTVIYSVNCLNSISTWQPAQRIFTYRGPNRSVQHHTKPFLKIHK